MAEVIQTTIRVDPAEAHIMVIRAEAVNRRWRKVPVTIKKLADGEFSAELQASAPHFLLVSFPGYVPQLRHYIPTANDFSKPIQINLPKVEPDAGQRAEKARIVLSSVQFPLAKNVAAGDEDMDSGLQTEIRNIVDGALPHYLKKEVDGCLLLAETDADVQAFRHAKRLIQEHHQKPNLKMVEDNLNAVLNGPHVEIVVECSKRNSKLKLRAKFLPTFAVRDFEAFVGDETQANIRRAAAANDRARNSFASPFDEEPSLLAETPLFTQQSILGQREQLGLLVNFVRESALSLHALYPRLVFTPEFPRSYQQIYLRIGGLAAGNGYPVWLESAPGQHQQDLGQMPLAELDPLQKLADQVSGEISIVDPTLTMPDVVRQMGDALSRWLGAPVINHLQQQWARAQNAQPRCGLRLRLCCDDWQVSGLPWEYLRLGFLDKVFEQDHYVARCTHFVLSRYPVPKAGAVANTQQVMSPVDIIHPLIVIPVANNDLANAALNENDLDPEEEMTAIRWGLRHAAQEPHGDEWRSVKLFPLPSTRPAKPATWEVVRDTLAKPTRTYALNVFHFIGHGRQGDDTVSLVGTTQAANGELIKDLRDSAGVWQLFSRESAVRLLVLQACKTASRSNKSLLSMGEQLSQSFPAVVAMQFMIVDESAREFAYSFYRGLALGHDVDVAVAEGRQRIAANHSIASDWGKPVVFGQTMQVFPLSN